MSRNADIEHLPVQKRGACASKIPAWSNIVTKSQSNFDFQLDSFRAVRPEQEADRLSFWVGRVVEVHRPDAGFVHEISAH